jgi:hypothetical protein
MRDDAADARTVFLALRLAPRCTSSAAHAAYPAEQADSSGVSSNCASGRAGIAWVSMS